MHKKVSIRGEEFLNQNSIITLEYIKNHTYSDPNFIDPIWDLTKSNEDDVPFSKDFLQLLLYVRNINKSAFHAIEGMESCIPKTWKAKDHNPERNLNGGGVMNVIRANHLEKSAVNYSCVWGPNYPALEGEHANKPFAAAGVSLISHPRNPFAPIMHLNVRCIKVFDNDKVTTWIGGGADLTPMVPFEEDTKLFHDAMKLVCTRNSNVANYEKYKKWAQEYFYIPHRKEERGVGGIFFDFVKVENDSDFLLLLDVGQFAARAYTEILARRIEMSYDDSLIEKHHYWRGRYAEFNLVYDRGTKFGLMSGGNHEAIFCSLPPQVKW